jgi:hypothetical protein
MENRLKIGDWIKADIIGLGFYEVVSMNDFHVNVKCLRIFNGKNPSYRGHITNCHYGVSKETGERIKIDQKKWFDRKVERRQI